MNILATVCARGGSKGVKNKNIREICGKPLIAYTLEQLSKWAQADHVIVSTDSTEIAEVAKKYNAEIPFLRPPELATDTIGKIPVLRHAIQQAETLYKKNFDLVVDLDPTAPIRTVSDLNACLKLFLEKRPQSLFSAVASHKSPYFNMVELDSQGFAQVSKKMDKICVRRQDSPAVYEMNASIYFYSRDHILNEATQSAIGDRSIIYVMPDLAGVDVDREIDFKYIEFLMKEGLWKNE